MLLCNFNEFFVCNLLIKMSFFSYIYKTKEEEKIYPVFYDIKKMEDEKRRKMICLCFVME